MSAKKNKKFTILAWDVKDETGNVDDVKFFFVGIVHIIAKTAREAEKKGSKLIGGYHNQVTSVEIKFGK